MTNDEEINDLRRSTAPSSYVEEHIEAETDQFQSELVNALRELDEGDRPKVIGVRDRHTTALLVALEESDHGLESLGTSLEQSLGRETDGEFDRSQILRLAIRIGLQEGAPSYFAQLKDATAEYARESL